MKKFLNKKTILLIISILIIIAGVINVCITGIEKSIEYKAGTRIEVYIPKGYEKQDIINIAEGSFNTDEILFCKIEKTNQVAGIKIIEYTEEQLKSYISKISEKYEIEEEKIEYHETKFPETKISTIITPYILPVLFITTLSLIYIIIKNIKSIDAVQISLRVLKILVIILGIYFGIIGLFRLQFSVYTMPVALALYIVSIIIAVNKKCE